MAKSTLAASRSPVTPALQKRVQALWRAPGEAGEVLLDGAHLLFEALAAGVPLLALWYTPRAAAREGAALAQAIRRLETHGVTPTLVGDATMAKLSPTKTPSGVLAIGTRPSWDPASLLRAEESTLLVLAADLQDPGNAGAVVRVAEAAGATGVWLTGESVDPFAWRALRGSMGSALRLPVVRSGTTRDAIAACLARGVQVVATDGRASRTFYDVDLRRPTALLLGNEGGGLSETLRRAVSTVVAIPMASTVNSLNVATAAAVLLYEAHRQRAEATTS